MRHLWIGLGVAAAVGLAALTELRAEPPLVPPANPPASPATPPAGGSSTVISGSGNGFGNSIIVSNNGPGSSSTVITNTRNGYGNKVVIVNNGKQVVVEDPPAYYGKNNAFWSTKVYCDALGTTVYFSTKDGQWYRYFSTEDVYRPLPAEWQYLIDPFAY